MTLPVQVATIRELCPVCRGRGLVRAETVAGVKACTACPHCTDARQLLILIETQVKR